MSTTSFDSTKEYLFTLLKSIKEAKTQLPDFQRGWVWNDDHIQSVLASISQSYPIGAVMMMMAGNTDVRFKTRAIEGVAVGDLPSPELLILDGQQRLTSLFQALFSGEVVSTKDSREAPIKRWYYIDIKKAIDSADREEAIFSLPEDKCRRNFRGEVIEDYSTPEKEFAAEVFPLSVISDYFDWRSGFSEAHDYDGEKLRLFNIFERDVIKRFEQYQVPVITLGRETPKEAVCQVFEKVNTGGVTLTVFELLTATYAADDFHLREDWAHRKNRLNKHKVLNAVENTDFLQSVTLLSTYAKKQTNNEAAVSCKRKDTLRLSLAEYRTWADMAEEGFLKAAKFLHTQKIFASRDIPYRTQLIPLAAILGLLGSVADNDGVKNKIARWYWCGVLGELYGGAIETRFAKDLPESVAWVNDGPEPGTVKDANFVSSRLHTLRTRNSAAYKGISALLMREGGLDFRSGDPIDVNIYFDESIDIHHIFPRDYCDSIGIEPGIRDCIVNKTPLSAKTNRMIGGNPPLDYIQKLQKSAQIVADRMDVILQSHLISNSSIRSNDFESFFKSRQNALLNRI